MVPKIPVRVRKPLTLNIQQLIDIVADVMELIATDANTLYAIYDAKTVLPDDGKEYPQMAHHMRGWEITYGIEAIRDWLFSQVKSS